MADDPLETAKRALERTDILQAEIGLIAKVINIGSNHLILKVGGSTLTLRADGTIEIKGRAVKINGSAVSISGRGQMTFASVKQLDVNGGNIRVQAERTFSVRSHGDAAVHSGGTLSIAGDSDLYLTSSKGNVRLRDHKGARTI
jgi:hypothetical protein